MRAAAALVLAAVALGGCDRGAPADEQAARNAPAPATASAASPADRPAEAPPASLGLSGEGIRPDLPFGTARPAVLAAVAGELGQPTDSGRNEECGEGPMDFVAFGGLSLTFQEDRLVGWFARAPFAQATSDGLRIGDPRSKVPVPVEESTLGMEFRTPGGVSGLLSEDGKTVGSLWAGLACLFR